LVNIVDPILLVLLLLFGLRGYFKGLFRESFSLLGLIIGFMLAVRYDEPVALLWSGTWKFSFVVVRVLSFVGLFFVVYFAFSLAGWLLHRSAKFLFLQMVNRIGGIVVGMGKGAAVLAMVIFLMTSFPLMPQIMRQRMDESYLIPPLQFLAEGLIRIGKANLVPQGESDTREAEGLDYF